MMMGFSNLHVRIPTSPIDSVAIVVLDCVVVVEVERVVDSTSRRPWAIPVDFAVVVVVVVVVVASSPLSSSSSSLRTCSPWTCCYRSRRFLTPSPCAQKNKLFSCTPIHLYTTACDTDSDVTSSRKCRARTDSLPLSGKNTRGSLSLSLSRGSWVLFDNPRTGSPSTKTSSNLAFWLSPRNARTGTPSNRARNFSNTALFLIRWLEEKRKRGKKMFVSFFCLKKAREREKTRKKIASLPPAPRKKASFLPVFGPSYVPILNENMAKSSPLSRNDQTFCCPFPLSGFPQIVSSVSSSSSLLPRRARCSFNSFNAFIFFFFWITQSDFHIIHHARVLL